MPKLKVYIKNNQKNVKIPVGLRLLVRKSCAAVLSYEHFGNDAEVSVSFVNNNEIRRLNKQFRGKDKSTDVLSFPLGEDGVYDINQETGALLLGDVVISMETAVKQAKTYGHSLEREVGFLTVHSMLHLLGYDHETSPLDAANMRERKKRYWASLAFQETLPSHPMLNELKAFFKSFTYAFSGVMHAVRHERNMRFHLCAAVTVLAVSAICGITRAELLAVVICISSVISAELINTAVENAVDAASKNISPKAKAAKDCAAGAVLICALFSAVCGTVIFINRERLTVLWKFFSGNLTAVLLLAVWLILAFMFVFKPKNN